MQNDTLFPALQRVYPTVTGTPFVEQGRAKTVDTAPALARSVDSGCRACSVAGTQTMPADSTATIFLASATGRLAPVLGVLLLLWGLIAWSTGWLGAIGG